MSEFKKYRIIVGLSGGVDSSVAAALLLEQGHEVIGVFMRNWHDDTVTINNECPWIDDSNDALLVAQHLNIPFQVLDLSQDYKSKIIDYMFAEYEYGRTPNPDILCNREIKFDVFLKHALTLGADFVATGHYCRKGVEILDGNTHYTLKAGKDFNKDQSYFLCQVSQEQLSKTLFPIGNYEKSEVRLLAEKFQVPTAKKKDSQGLCFIGKIKLPIFLQSQLKPKTGNVILLPDFNNPDSLSQINFTLYKEWQTKNTETSFELLCEDYQYHEDMGTIIGQHQGAHYYTIGQRKGLGIGGQEIPLFVVKTNTVTNTIFVVSGEFHPLLFRKGLRVPATLVHWIDNSIKMQINEERKYQIRIRYRQKLESCTLIQREDYLYIRFDKPMKGISPGPFAAWYHGDELVGSGVIQS